MFQTSNMKILYTAVFLTISLFSISVELKAQQISNARWISRDTTSSLIRVYAEWKKGEMKKFRVKKRTKNYQGDSLITEKLELDGIVQFHVMDTTDSTYQMEYRILENLRDTSKDPVLPLEGLDLSSDALALRYTTDGNGAFKSYENRQPIEDKLNDLMKIIMADGENKSKPLNAVEKKTKDAISEKLANGKVLFAGLYDIFIYSFHNLQGYDTGINDTLAYSEAVPGIWGNKPINYDCYVYVTSIDTVSYEVKIDLEKYADLTDYLKEYAEFLKTTAENAGAKPKEEFHKELLKLDMRMETFISSYIDLNTGWPNFIRITKSVFVKDPTSKTETVKDEIWTLDNVLTDE
jgi:hypothetical protein